ncbi:MAG TPA: MFS transporter [Pirellulales bacterium]|nr:MFS transporter [Pirellulales bacterium]
MDESGQSGRRLQTRDTLRLGLLFGTIYFVQGMSEPTTGLVSQPNQSLLCEWGESDEQITAFVAILAAPWCFKPLFGFLSDFFPLLGYRRKSYMVVTSLVAMAGFFALAWWTPWPVGAYSQLLSWLLVPTVAVIFANVVVDAMMIEAGQPRGITGRLQSVQWAAIYAGAILTGKMGGILSEFQEQRLGFLICGCLMSVTFLLSLFGFKETSAKVSSHEWRDALVAVVRSVRSPGVVAVGAFTFLWHFNPFCQAVVYLHMKKHLGFSEDFYGDTMSLIAVGSLVACVTYGMYCRRIPMRRMVHLAVALGVASTWGYWYVSDRTSAVAVSLLTGFTYMTASMILVDLAARACPIAAAGTLFALFMAACNTSSAITTWLGGRLYQSASEHWGGETGFTVVVAAGGLFCAGSWWAIRFLPAHLLGLPEEAAQAPLVLPELPALGDRHALGDLVLADLPLAAIEPTRRTA